MRLIWEGESQCAKNDERKLQFSKSASKYVWCHECFSFNLKLTCLNLNTSLQTHQKYESIHIKISLQQHFALIQTYFFQLKIEQSKNWHVNNQSKAAIETPYSIRQFLNLSESKGGGGESYVNI